VTTRNPLPHPLTGALFASPVEAGSGWPDDPAERGTPVADGRDAVVTHASEAADLETLEARVSVCRACPRLVSWREQVAVEKRRSFAAEPYWGRPIAGWGSSRPEVLVIGLAPAAHGGNRTGRIFTGDRSGDWLFAALHRAGLAAQPTSAHAGDGQALIRTRMLAVVRCAPPDNKPTPDERDTCQPWLDAELSLVLGSVRSMVCLGSFAWDASLRALARQGITVPRPRPRFGHGAAIELDDLRVLGCFHPSQQNTFTGKLTAQMLDAVFAAATRDLP
jgi:uracil-DNA glycosylase family 4